MSDGVSSDYIDSLGMSAETYAELSDDEQQAAIDSYLDTLEAQNLSAEEIEEKLSELKADLEEISDMYDEYAEELEDLETGDMSDAEKADLEEVIETCETIIEELDEGEGRVDDSYDDYATHNKSYDSGESSYVSDLTYDGQTYVYDMNGGDVYYEAGSATLVSYDPSTGTIIFKVTNPDNPEEYCYVEIHTNNASNPFGEESDEDYLKDEGVTNDEGEVIQDVNADGYMNQADIDAALEARDGSTLEDGETQIYFSSGIDSNDLETLKTTWPEDLLKICYWGDSTDSFYDELFGTDDDESNVGVIEGYSDTYNGFTDVNNYTNTGGKSSDQLQSYYQAAVDALYGYIDDPSAKDINEIWSELLAQWQSEGLSEVDIANLIHYLVIGVAINDSTHFSTFFSTIYATLEDRLDYDKSAYGDADSDNMWQADKLTYLLLETYAAGNTAVWTTVFSADGVTSGLWGAEGGQHDENAAVIEEFKNVASLGGLTPTGNESSALANEQAMNEEDAQDAEEGGTVVIDDNYYNTLYTSAVSYGDKYGGDDILDTDGITQDELKMDLQGLINTIHDLGEVSIDELCNAIQTYIARLTGTHIDDVACTFLIMIKETNATLYNQLLTNSEFKSFMKNNIDNGSNVPDGYDKLEDDLGLTERVVIGDG